MMAYVILFAVVLSLAVVIVLVANAVTDQRDD